MYRWENAWPSSLAHPQGIQLEPTNQIIGAQLCSWDNKETDELNDLRFRLPAMCERVWSHDKQPGNFWRFDECSSWLNQVLEKLM